MTKEICVVNCKGLHARPATVFAEAASTWDDDVRVSFGKKTVNGKSLIALMSLAVPRDGVVIVSLGGDDPEELMAELVLILGKNYD